MPLCGPAEVDAAVAGAAKAAPGWARTSPGDRAAALKAAAREPARPPDEVAELQARESGKPRGDSRGGVEAGTGRSSSTPNSAPLHRGRALQGGWDATDVMRVRAARRRASC